MLVGNVRASDLSDMTASIVCDSRDDISRHTETSVNIFSGCLECYKPEN